MSAQARWRAALPACDTATLVWLAAAALLAVLTLVAFSHLRQFDEVQSPWPFDPGFATLADGSAPVRAPGEEPAGWQVEGARDAIAVTDGVLRLRNDDPEAGVGVRQVWHLQPGGPRTFKLSADVGSENIRGGRKGFRVGEITLVADRDMARPYFLNMHRLARRDSTRPMDRFVATFHFGQQAERAELAIRLRHATGELKVANLKLIAMGERPLFRQVRLGLAIAWAAVMAAGLYLFGRGIDHRRSAAALGVAGIAGAGLLLMPENLRERVLEGVARFVPLPSGRVRFPGGRRPFPDLHRRRAARPAEPPGRSLGRPAGAAGRPGGAAGAPAVLRRAAHAHARRLGDQRHGRHPGLEPRDGLAVVASGRAVRDAAPVLDHPAAAAGEAAPVVGLALVQRVGRAAWPLADRGHADLAFRPIGALADLVVDLRVGTALVLHQDRMLRALGERLAGRNEAGLARRIARIQALAPGGIQRVGRLEAERRLVDRGAGPGRQEQRQENGAGAADGAGPRLPVQAAAATARLPITLIRCAR